MTLEKNTMSHYVVKGGYYTLVVGVSIGLLYCLYLLFVPLLVSVLLSFVLDPMVNRLETRGMRRLSAVLSIYLIIIVAVAAGVFLFVPRLVVEARNLMDGLPRYKAMFVAAIQSLQWWIEGTLPQVAIPDLLDLIRARFPGGGGINVDAVIAYSSSFFSVLSVVVIIPIVTFFLLMDGYLLQKALLRMVPNRYFEMFFLLFHKITTALKMFIRGQLIDALAVGIMTTAFLAPVLPYAFVVGLIAGVGNLIPYLGPIIGFFGALFVLFIQPEGFEVWRLVLVVGLFALVQFLEGTFVYPIAVGKSVDLHPLVVIIGVTIGGQLAGVLGMVIAVPIISIAKVSLEVLHTNLKSYQII